MAPKQFWRDISEVPTAIPAAKSPPPCYTASSPSFGLTAEGLSAWAKSPEFLTVVRLAQSYAAYDSLQSDNSRALLYHLILTLRPERVLEIGTFRAGTARFLTQSLHHAGRGVLYTIDPFGIDNNVPAIIAAWPMHLQNQVRFGPLSSADFFDRATTLGMTFDLVLIDGNHEYAYAAFDLACAAQLMNPGGIVVLDNIDQPGPRYATQQFLIANPGWTEVPGAGAEPVTEGTASARLPVLPKAAEYRLAWEEIDGITFIDIGSGPVPGFSAVNLEATASDGYHRIGMQVVGLSPGRKHRLVVWLAPVHGNFVMVDFRDSQAPSSQIFCDLPREVVDRQTGPLATAWLERGGDKWKRLFVDFDCPSGTGHIYVFVQSKRGEVVYNGRDSAAVSFGGVEILTANAQGEYEHPQTSSAGNLANRDLRALDVTDPFGFVAPSFPGTKFFVLKAPDGLALSNIPRSFGSRICEATGANWLELELAAAASGRLHYQIFFRAFSNTAQPEELTLAGVEHLHTMEVGKFRIRLASPLRPKATRAHAHFRIEIILAFVPDEPDGCLYLRKPPTTSDFN